MDYKQLIERMTPDTFKSLKRAVELGKWPDGRSLTREQRESCMQAIIAWGELHLSATDRVGYIDKGHKEGENCDTPDVEPINWK